MTFFYEGISLQNQRSVNMDSLLLKSRQAGGQDLCMAAVCDGVGSLANGAFAAAMAVQMLSNWFENLEETADLGARLREYAPCVNQGILARAQGLETASTLSCLLLWEDGYCIVHAGDSRIYLWEAETLCQLTPDQVREGRLTSAVGHWENPEIFYTEGVRRKGQRFLLCSDGLYKKLDPESLAAALGGLTRRNLRRTLEQLAKSAIDRGERDNISAALVMNDER